MEETFARGLRKAQCGGLPHVDPFLAISPDHPRAQASQERVIDEGERKYYSFGIQYYGEAEVATNVTVKGQVTLPKAVREAAKIRPGDRVNVRVRREGGVIIEAEAAVKSAEAYMSRLEDMSRRQPIRGFSTDEIMRMTRGDD
jgi:AbrB family looped-hinge helix DNA binding protein